MICICLHCYVKYTVQSDVGSYVVAVTMGRGRCRMSQVGGHCQIHRGGHQAAL
jgi:hypothetical protein